MKPLLLVLLSSYTVFATNTDTLSQAAEESSEISPWLSAGMIFFGLMTFIPYIYMTFKEKMTKSKP